MLRCFVDDLDLRFPAISALSEAIADKFDQAGILVAFPQRDLHFDALGSTTFSFLHVRSRVAPDSATPAPEERR
jgi:potassium efflux system protein